jgi:hypothetical protein
MKTGVIYMISERNKDEMIEALQLQNEYWAEYAEKEMGEKVVISMFLIATTLISLFGTGWIISDLIIKYG